MLVYNDIFVTLMLIDGDIPTINNIESGFLPTTRMQKVRDIFALKNQYLCFFNSKTFC